MGMSIAELECRANLYAEYELLKQPSTELRAQMPDYDPYAARRIADKGLESFNVMLRTLRTDPAYAMRSLDLICARRFLFDFADNYVRAITSAGFTRHRRVPFRDKEAYTDFLMSLPSQRVAAMIQFHYLKDVHRAWTINDLRDIDALSIAIPYCNVVVTDKKAWDVTVNRAHLDREFDTAIYCRLADLAAHVQTSRESRSANRGIHLPSAHLARSRSAHLRPCWQGASRRCARNPRLRPGEIWLRPICD